MTIIRRQRNRDFTVVANTVFRDGSLSFEAMGLASFLLSKPDHWEIHVKQLARVGKCGRDKMQRIVKELISARFLTRDRAHDLETGKFVGYEYVMRDEPLPADQSTAPQPENPVTVEPQPENPSTGKPCTENTVTVVNTDSEANTDSEKKREKRAREESEQADIDRRWLKIRSAYPGAALDRLELAKALFVELSAEDRKAAHEAVPGWAAMVKGEKRRPPLQEYLKERKWELVPKSKDGAPAAPPGYHVAGAFDRAWWWLFHGCVAKYGSAAGNRGTPEYFAVTSQISKAVSGIGWKVADAAALARAEEGGRALIQVRTDGDQAQRWQSYYLAVGPRDLPSYKRGVRMPLPDQAPFIFVPAGDPPTLPNSPTQQEIDEALG